MDPHLASAARPDYDRPLTVSITVRKGYRQGHKTLGLRRTFSASLQRHSLKITLGLRRPWAGQLVEVIIEQDERGCGNRRCGRPGASA